MTRYVPARHYISFGAAALALAGFRRGWADADSRFFVPAVLFFLTAVLLNDAGFPARNPDL